MSWQDDLRQLDQALAEGRIAADDYRRRRDALLATASGAGGQQPAAPSPGGQPPQPTVGQPQTGSQPAATPTPPPAETPAQQPASPFAPAFRWDPVPDATQAVVNNQPPPPSADTTQVVSTQGRADSERTQIVRPVGQPHTPPPGFQQQAQPPWQATPPGGQPQSPWGSDDFAAPVVAPTPSWYAQGPEVFDEGGSSPKKSKRWLIILVVVLVLAGAGAGVFFIVNNSGNPAPDNTAQSNQPAPPPPSPTKTRPSDPNEAALEDLPRGPGQLNTEGKIIEVPQLVGLGLLSQAEMDLLTTAGAKKVSWKTATKKTPDDGPTPDTTSAMVIPLETEAAAEKLVADLRAYQDANGFNFEEEPLPNMPPSVVFEKNIQKARAIYRGLYVSGKNVVRVNSVQEPLTSEAALSGTYRDHMAGLLKAIPVK
jgi:hypothetical protein